MTRGYGGLLLFHVSMPIFGAGVCRGNVMREPGPFSHTGASRGWRPRWASVFLVNAPSGGDSGLRLAGIDTPDIWCPLLIVGMLYICMLLHITPFSIRLEVNLSMLGKYRTSCGGHSEDVVEFIRGWGSSFVDRILPS